MTSTADSTTSKAQSLRQSSSSPTDRQPLPPVAKVLKLSATANDNNHHHQNSNNNSDCHHNIVRGGDTNGRDNECADTVPCAGTTLPPQRPVVVVGTNRCVVEPTAGGGGVPLPRLIPRNLPMAQSRNRVQIEHNQGFKIYRLLRHDWFHVFLRLSTARSVLCLLTLWTAFILIFAALYVWVDNQHLDVSCGLGPAGSPINFGGAFAFSLQTCTTGTRIVVVDHCFFSIFQQTKWVIVSRLVGGARFAFQLATLYQTEQTTSF